MRAIRELPARRAAPASSGRPVLRRRPGQRLAHVARRRRAARRCSSLLATAGAPGGSLALLPLAALAAWLALSISWSSAARPLVGLRQPGARLPPLRRARPLARRPHARARARARRAARRGRRLVARREGAAVALRLRPAGCDAAARSGRPLEPARAARRLRAAARALAAAAIAGTLLAYGWIVALAAHLLARRHRHRGRSSSRAWLALTDERLESAATLVAAALPAAVVVAASRSRCPASRATASRRTRAGTTASSSARCSLAGAVAAVGARARCRGRASRRALRRGARSRVGVAAVVAVVALRRASKGTGSGAVGNSGGRIGSTSSNFRLVWWRQAWHGFEHHELAGTGAGSFHLTNLRYRTTLPRLDDRAARPAGAVPRPRRGSSGSRSSCSRRRRSLRARPAPRAATSSRSRSSCPRTSLHSLVDIDWDFVAVSAPVFLVAGALAGGARRCAACSPFALLAAAGVALLAFGALLLPWLGERWSAQARTPSARRARRDARASARARSTRCSSSR